MEWRGGRGREEGNGTVRGGGIGCGLLGFGRRKETLRRERRKNRWRVRGREKEG